MEDELNPTDTMQLDTLDQTVLKGLDFLAEVQANGKLPEFDEHEFKRPLCIGSGLSDTTLRKMYNNVDAVFANESDYEAAYQRVKGSIDQVVILSISGGKHSPSIAEWAKGEGLHTRLLTCNPQTPVLDVVDDHVLYPSPSKHAANKSENPDCDQEPLTYNFATYTGLIMSKTGESAAAAKKWIMEVVEPILESFEEKSGKIGQYESFFGLVPENLHLLGYRGIVKFQELFSQQYGVDFCTPEDTKHAKTVVPTLGEGEQHIDPKTGHPIQYKKQLFMSFGFNNSTYGNEEDRLNIPFPENADYAAGTAIIYYVIGRLQDELPPLYKLNVAAYAQEQGRLFGSKMSILQDYHKPK